MTDAAHRLTLARLPRGRDMDVDLTPDAAERTALADDLGLSALRKLRLTGRLSPEGAQDWRLTAKLGATVVQPCVITAEPVTTRIDETVTRRYLAEMPEPDGEEVEMPEDDSAEPLPAVLDLSAVIAEALALALPPYPRAPGAALEEAVFAPPGVTPLTDEAAKPLAGLAALRDRFPDPPEDDDTDGESA